MPNSYFDLSAKEQHELLAAASNDTGRDASVIEKDIWLCFVLQHLFGMPGGLPMAFKGGTSLSKVFSVIERFSEDVDVTIDYRHLGCEIPLSEMMLLSGRRRTQIGDALKAKVQTYTTEIVRPYLKAQLDKLPCGQECDVAISEDGENLHVIYPSRVPERGVYLREFVLLEFGGRNLIEPNGIYTIQPEIAKLYEAVNFPMATGVVVLAAERTFWEKVTLIHAQCNRPFAEGVNRVSRHWYDLAMLARHDCGKRAKLDLALLSNVIDLKSVFFKSATTRYELCLAGELNLLPDKGNLPLLIKDYLHMQGAGMLNGHEFPMEQILDELGDLQAEINKLATMG